MVERGGDVVAKAVDNVKTKTILPILRDQIQQGTELMTDEYNIYNQTQYFFNHHVINHGIKQYVSGNVHTNTIEGFWSQLKNSIKGTYKFVSRNTYRAISMSLLGDTITENLKHTLSLSSLRRFRKSFTHQAIKTLPISHFHIHGGLIERCIRWKS